MRSFQSFFCALAVLTLAACGGGPGSNSLAPAGYDPGTRDPSGSTVGFEKATLWVGYDSSVSAFSTNGSGAVSPEFTLGAYAYQRTYLPGIVDIAIAPDGTRWVLEDHSFAEGGRGFRLLAYASGSTEVENIYGDDVSTPFAVGLAGNGIMVGYVDPTGVWTIATYRYAASNTPPKRTFLSSTRILNFAEGNDGLLYVDRPDRVDVYDPKSTGCCPVRSIVLHDDSGNPVSSGLFAVGPDSTIYLGVHAPNKTMYVNAYPPGSGTIGRRIGPLPADNGSFAGPAITVDSKNRLYVATQGTFYRFGPNASGATAQRVMTDSTLSRVHALAVGPAL